MQLPTSSPETVRFGAFEANLVVGELRKTLFSTDPIESAFSMLEEKCGRVKKWQGGDMKLRWVARGLLCVEGQFRKVKGYREIPQLVAASLSNLVRQARRCCGFWNPACKCLFPPRAARWFGDVLDTVRSTAS
jgi:hypothetical protein